MRVHANFLVRANVKQPASCIIGTRREGKSTWKELYYTTTANKHHCIVIPQKLPRNPNQHINSALFCSIFAETSNIQLYVKNSSIFSLIWMCWLSSAGDARSRTLHHQNPPVLNWKCRLMQVDLYNGCKTVVVVLLLLIVNSDNIISLKMAMIIRYFYHNLLTS